MEQFFYEILKYLIPALLAGVAVKLLTLKGDKKKTEAETEKLLEEAKVIAVNSLSSVIKDQAAECKRLGEAVSAVTNELTTWKQNYQKLEKEFQNFKRESLKRVQTINLLRSEVQQLKSERQELEIKIKSLEDENSVLKRRVSELEKHDS